MPNSAIQMVTRLMLAVWVLAAASAAAVAQELQFRTYQDVTGFSCEFPSDWSFAEAKNYDRVFTSAGIPNATIIIQVIDRAVTKEKTAAAQLEALKDDFLNAPDGRILTEGAAPIAGQQAPYLIAAYTTADIAGSQRPFRHIQMAVTAPKVFLLMSYSAPDDIFDAHLRVFQNCSATLEVAAADPPAVAPDPSEPVDVPGETAESGEAEEPVTGASVQDTLVWRRNDDRGFWVAVPSIWSNTIDPTEPYSADMQHPDRLEGVVVWVVDMDASSTVKEYADAWEQVLAKEIFFMAERLAVPAAEHPGVGVAEVSGLMREYQGEMNGATVRSVAAYVLNGKRGYTVIGYHFLGDYEGEKRIREAVDSFRLAPPEG
jgi:hypothetical protein